MPKFEMMVKAHIKVTVEAVDAQTAYEAASDELAGYVVADDTQPVAIEIGHLVGVSEIKEID